MSRFIDDAVRQDRNIIDLPVCQGKAQVTWYRIPNTTWTKKQTKARIDEAVKWFKLYCINLEFVEFDPKKEGVGKKMNKQINTYNNQVVKIPRAKIAKAGDLATVHKSLLKIYKLVRRKAKKGNLIVLFLDEWNPLTGVPGAFRKFRVSANDGKRGLIGIDRYDVKSPHILTHELTHALRKLQSTKKRKRNKPCLRQFIKVNKVKNLAPRRWEDHTPPGRNANQAMVRPKRPLGAFQPLRNLITDKFTIREYMTILSAGYVQATLPLQAKIGVPKAPPFRIDESFRIEVRAPSTEVLQEPQFEIVPTDSESPGLSLQGPLVVRGLLFDSREFSLEMLEGQARLDITPLTEG